MPFRRKRDDNPGDREVDQLYGGTGPYSSHGQHPDEYDDFGGYEHDPEDDLSWAGFGEDGFFHEEHRPRSPTRRVLGCLIPIAIVAGIVLGGYAAYQHLLNNWGSPSCKFNANGYEYQWDPDQTQSAATIVAVGVYKKGMPPRAAVVATTTAIQESKLRNLAYGDLDSLGLFQQRKSQGWGTAAQIQDPIYSSGSFYNTLAQVQGWESKSIGAAAQAVQRSGFPDAYAEHQAQGEVITAAMTGTAHEGLGCRLDPAKANGSPSTIVSQLKAESGLAATISGTSVQYHAKSVNGAQAIASWAIAHADSDNITSVTVGDRAWERHRGRDGWKWTDAKQPSKSSTDVRIDVETGK